MPSNSTMQTATTRAGRRAFAAVAASRELSDNRFVTRDKPVGPDLRPADKPLGFEQIAARYEQMLRGLPAEELVQIVLREAAEDEHAQLRLDMMLVAQQNKQPKP
jgi:hypothetical protein